jgi:hypothetical protein
MHLTPFVALTYYTLNDADALSIRQRIVNQRSLIEKMAEQKALSQFGMRGAPFDLSEQNKPNGAHFLCRFK